MQSEGQTLKYNDLKFLCVYMSTGDGRRLAFKAAITSQSHPFHQHTDIQTERPTPETWTLKLL